MRRIREETEVKVEKNELTEKFEGYEHAEVIYEWLGRPFQKVMRRLPSPKKYYYFYAKKAFSNNNARMQATNILEYIKLNSGINGHGYSGLCGSEGGFRNYSENGSNLQAINEFMTLNGPIFKQKMAKFGYFIDWMFVERTINHTVYVGGVKGQKAIKYPMGWVLFFNKPNTGRPPQHAQLDHAGMNPAGSYPQHQVGQGMSHAGMGTLTPPPLSYQPQLQQQPGQNFMSPMNANHPTNLMAPNLNRVQPKF